MKQNENIIIIYHARICLSHSSIIQKDYSKVTLSYNTYNIYIIAFGLLQLFRMFIQSLNIFLIVRIQYYKKNACNHLYFKSTRNCTKHMAFLFLIKGEMIADCSSFCTQKLLHKTQVILDNANSQYIQSKGKIINEINSLLALHVVISVQGKQLFTQNKQQ